MIFKGSMDEDIRAIANQTAAFLFAESVVVATLLKRLIDGETDIAQGIKKGTIEIKKQRFCATWVTGST